MRSNHGPYIDKFYPEPYKQLVEVSRTLKKIYPEVDLPDSLIELISVRISQINGCGTCLSIHVPAARRAGVAEKKLDALPAWRMVDEYTAEEKAALQLAESLTLLDRNEGHLAARTACSVFAEEQVAALEWAIIMINAFNRVSIASGHPLL